MSASTDGLERLLGVLSLQEIASLIERTAQWVAPETFRLLPLWFPEYARRSLLYKAKWSEPLTNTNRITKHSVHKSEANIRAGDALTLALGLKEKDRTNWSCCHIWGVDDATFQSSNHVVQDHRFYSCVANVVLLPTPLKAFTDSVPAVKSMLRICARNLYGWQCDHDAMSAVNADLDRWTTWDAYPKSWPRTLNGKRPPGTVELSPLIRASARKRLDDIREDLVSAGEYYPREKVRATLEYWKIEL